MRVDLNTCTAFSVCALLGVCGTPAMAQYASGFETADGIAAAPEGTDLNGQDEFYNPDPPNSVTALAYTYMDNALGLPANPGGDAQFVAGTGPANNMFVRSQRDMTYGDGTGAWTVCYDTAALYVGELPSAQNIGSFSTQTFPGAATFIALHTWTDPNTAKTWDADFVWFDANDAQLTEKVPNEAFQNLMTNHWYQRCVTFDLDTNRILEVTVTDLTSGETASYEPPDRYLDGGEAGGLPTPTGFRFFAGSAGTFGNVLAFDNLDISPAEVGCPADCNGDGALNVLDFVCFQGEWQQQTAFGDCNGDGAYNVLDFVCYQGLFQAGCP